MTKKVADGNIVTIECVGRVETGEAFMDSSVDGPVMFQVGDATMLKGINKGVIGMSVGEEKDLELPPADAFGEYDESLIVTAPLENLPPNLEVGMQLKGEGDTTGEGAVMTVVEVSEEKGRAALDGNHILAGEKLLFHIKVIDLK